VSEGFGEEWRAHTAISQMGQFSDEGLWWWDGASWIATSQVVLPQLPMTEFEKSGKLEVARAEKAKGQGPFWRDVVVWGFIGLTPVNRNGFRDYRTWTIEQLALATAYLLGPDEPLLAAEVSAYAVWDAWARDLAVAVTAGHVLVFRIDSAEGQPRWIALAGRVSDVKIESRTGLMGRLWPALEISGRMGRWIIHGFGGEFDPEPVLGAWRNAVGAAAAAR